MNQPHKKMIAQILSVILAAGTVCCASQASAADTIQTVATSYLPTVNETIDASGFRHPGVGLTRDILETLRTQVRAGKEPWTAHFNAMLLSTAASRNVQSANQSSADNTRPAGVAFNSQGVESKFITDSLRAYTQAVLYYLTGDEVYRANAMRIIRIWAQMDPSQYAYYTDAHIHAGIPLNRMVTAAEILRYTSCQTETLRWKDEDTTNFTNNLITPVTEVLLYSNSYFMNQHNYPLLGAMAGYIFTGNRDRYNEAVEWFTVNKTAVDQGQNGAVKQLFRLVEKNDLTGESVTPMVEHVEMGRDQAHGAGDITNVAILARMLLGQGTKVDPVEGTASTAPNAVGPYEFLNDRILDATEYFARYMMGYDTPWVPTAAHTAPDGTPTIVYQRLATSYRGRLTQNTWEPFYYYKYARGMNMEERAPYFTQMYASRVGYNWDGVDGGGDFWLYLPQAAETEGAQYLVKPLVNPYRELEDRFSSFDGNAVALREDGTGFVRVTATAQGSRLALVGSNYSTTAVGFRVRTNGGATMEVFGDTITLPDTKGQWRYVEYALSPYQSLGTLLYMTIKGNGTTVDIDHINCGIVAGQAPQFTSGNADLNLFTYSGSTSAIQYDFAATDATAGDAVTYQADNLPPGAVFNAATGAFSWTPTQAGTYSFVVSASDGKTVTTRDVKIVVGADRQAAVDAITALYDPAALYVATARDAYNAAYAAAAAALPGAADAEFQQKLAALYAAAVNLQVLTPLLGDGSMDYSKMVTYASIGTNLPKAVDGDLNSGFGTSSDQPILFDFGPSFKISADAFQLQVRQSFPERVGGAAVFGSNDNETWVRLTPGLTTISEDMQTLPVQDDLKTQKFRFIKFQMVQPTSSLFELCEIRMFGTRHETVNKLASVSIASMQSVKNRIIPGNTVSLTFQSTEPISDVAATIQGLPATLATTDNLNWTATAALPADVTPGKVKFNLTYRTAQGIEGDPVVVTTDGTSLFVADQTGLLDLMNLTSMKDSSGRSATDVVTSAAGLFDNNMSTFTDLRVNGSGAGGWIMFDFKGGGTARIARAEVLARQDQVARIKGTVIQGSNDATTWQQLTNGAQQDDDWQTLVSKDGQPYRYIRVYNANTWYGNVAEVRLYGQAESSNKLSTVSMSSVQAQRGRIVPGNTVKLSFTAKEAINNVTATIQGQAATVTSADNVTFTAAATLPQGVAAGDVKFEIDYQTQDGATGYPNSSTTDSSALYLVDESDVIKNLPTVATLIDSTYNRPPATTVAMVDNLGDNNVATVSDFRIGTNNAGSGSYIVFDFKAGNQVNLTSVELAPRQDQYYTRMKGTVVQGSNDGVTWTTLTTAAAGSNQNWQTVAVTSNTPYRYLRLYNGNAWYGNIAEVRFHGSLHGADTTAPVTSATTSPVMPASGWATGTVTVNLSASDAGSAATTYYSVDGGATRTGTSVALAGVGTHTVSYWSVDAAGNAEPSQSLTVNIGPIDVSTSVQLTRQGATLNRVTGKYVGGVTITNTSGAVLGGPLQLRLDGLTGGITLDNASGGTDSGPYVTLSSALNPGASVTVPLTFSNPNRALITYTPRLYRGIF